MAARLARFKVIRSRDRGRGREGLRRWSHEVGSWPRVEKRLSFRDAPGVSSVSDEVAGCRSQQVGDAEASVRLLESLHVLRRSMVSEHCSRSASPRKYYWASTTKAFSTTTLMRIMALLGDRFFID